jgi:hypothetical protein
VTKELIRITEVVGYDRGARQFSLSLIVGLTDPGDSIVVLGVVLRPLVLQTLSL